MLPAQARYIAWLNSAPISQETGGGKAHSLSVLAAAGFPVPAGFCLTAAAYRRFDAVNALSSAIAGLLRDIPDGDSGAPRRRAAQIEPILANCKWPADLVEALEEAYATFGDRGQ